MLSQAGMDWEYWSLSGDSYVDRARNSICARFLNSDRTHLLFIDSDLSWDLQGFVNLLQSPYDVTGGAYPFKNKYDEFAVSIQHDARHAPLQHNITGHIIAEYIPAGFMLLTKSCISRMSDYYKGDWYYDADGFSRIVSLFEINRSDNKFVGEDITFCRKWIGMGGIVYVEPRITFGHCGMKAFEGNFDRHLTLQAQIARIAKASTDNHD